MSTQNMIALKNAMVVILFLTIFLLSRSVFALEIKYSLVNPFSGETVDRGRGALLLKGEIVPGDYNYLLNVIKNNFGSFVAGRTFILASPGGDVQEAMKIARLVKGVYAKALVGRGTGICGSSCFLIFASAALRFASPGTVGVHRPYVHPRRLASLSPSQSVALQNDIFRQTRSYLQELQVPTSIIDTMFQRASSEVYWLSDSELKEQIGHIAPWYEQFLIARCGLNKSIIQRYFSTSDQSLVNNLIEVEDCGIQLTAGETFKFLTNEFEKTGKFNKD